MSANPTIKPDVAYTEAPASWNTSYITPEGYVCRITIRGENGRDLLDKANSALTFLKEHGCMPEQKFNRSGNAERKMCSIHQCELKRFEKGGKSWFSHRMDDGSYCYGKK